MVKTFSGPLKPAALAFSVMMLAAGCGYTTQSNLPEHVKTIHVQPVKNGIDLSAEVTDKDRFRVYRPGIEVDITNAIINRFVFDGNLKIASSEKANALVTANLIDYRREPLRYSAGDDIQEYRLSITLDVSVTEAGTGKVIWRTGAFTGDTTFFLSGPRAVSEDEAAAKAVEDLARRVVENTIETW